MASRPKRWVDDDWRRTGGAATRGTVPPRRSETACGGAARLRRLPSRRFRRFLGLFQDEELERGGRIEDDLGLAGEDAPAERLLDHALEVAGEGGLEGDAGVAHEILLSRLDQGLLGGREDLVHDADDVRVVED